ncbi:hypothetical protein VCV18_012016 [Metarhizium anisopliae]
MARLRPDLQSEEFRQFASFFAEDSAVYLCSMREHVDPAKAVQPPLSTAATIEHLRDIPKDQMLEERRIVSQVTNEVSKKNQQ